MDERAFYLTLCQKEHLSKRELNRQIDTALYERSMIGTPKISPMVREIAPQAEQIFRDQYVLEFIGGKDYEHENTMKKALIARMKDFVLEFGKDFLFGAKGSGTSVSQIRDYLLNNRNHCGQTMGSGLLCNYIESFLTPRASEIFPNLFGSFRFIAYICSVK